MDTTTRRVRERLADSAAVMAFSLGTSALIAGLLALCLQGSLLLRHAPAAVSDAFCASRLGGDWGAVLGTLPAGTDVASLVERSAVRPSG